MKKFVFVMSFVAAMMFVACTTNDVKPTEPAVDDTTKVEVTTTDSVVIDSVVATENAEAPEVEAPAQEEASAEATK